MRLKDIKEDTYRQYFNIHRQYLDIRKSGITDLEGIEEFKNVRTFVADNIPDLKNLHLLSACRNIHTLSIENCDVEDISFIEELNKLTTLFVPYNKIKDISAVSKLRNIAYIDAGYNQLSEVNIESESIYSVIACSNIITEFKLTAPDVVKLDISSNPLEDIEVISDSVKYFNASDTHINYSKLYKFCKEHNTLMFNNNTEFMESLKDKMYNEKLDKIYDNSSRF